MGVFAALPSSKWTAPSLDSCSLTHGGQVDQVVPRRGGLLISGLHWKNKWRKDGAF